MSDKSTKDTQIRKLYEALKGKGLKLTNQRRLVAQEILSMASHFTVDHLADSLRENKNKISRATLYRIVSIMVEAGLLEEHDFGQNSKFYEYTSDNKHHDHMICLDCDQIEEFVDPLIEKNQIQISQSLGFELSDHSLNLYGKCLKLKKTGSCSNKKS